MKTITQLQNEVFRELWNMYENMKARWLTEYEINHKLRGEIQELKKMQDIHLPPGVSQADIDRHFGEPDRCECGHSFKEYPRYTCTNCGHDFCMDCLINCYICNSYNCKHCGSKADEMCFRCLNEEVKQGEAR